MEEISRIIAAISSVTGLSRTDILLDNNSESKYSRHILCYIALRDHTGLCKHLTAMTGFRQSQCFICACESDRLMKEDDTFLQMMNETRQALGLKILLPKRASTISKRKEKALKELQRKTDRRNQLTLFGFAYSEEDMQEMRAVMESAAVYMNGLCSTGIQDTERILRKSF